MGSSCCIKQKCGLGATKYSVISIIKKVSLTRQRGPVRGALNVPCLNFKPFHVAVSEGSHVAVGMLSIKPLILISEMFNYRIFNVNAFS